MKDVTAHVLEKFLQTLAEDRREQISVSAFAEFAQSFLHQNRPSRIEVDSGNYIVQLSNGDWVSLCPPLVQQPAAGYMPVSGVSDRQGGYPLAGTTIQTDYVTTTGPSPSNRT